MVAGVVLALWLAEAGAPAHHYSAKAHKPEQAAHATSAEQADGGVLMPSGTPKATTPAVRDELPGRAPTDNAPLPPPPDKTTAPRVPGTGTAPPVPDRARSDLRSEPKPDAPSADATPSAMQPNQNGGGAKRTSAIKSRAESGPDPRRIP